MIDAVAFLHRMVEIESLSGQETAVAEFIVEQMGRFGYDEAFVDEAGNGVGIRTCPDERGEISQEIVLLGHMDTVPGVIPVRIDAEGRLHGRGTVDAKGPLATFVVAGAQAELAPGTRLVVIGATEEEAATSKGARFAATQYQPDFCIIGEPSGWEGITLGYKGRVLLEYALRQGMAHTAGSEMSVGEVAVNFWLAMQAYCQQFNAGRAKLFDQLLPSIRQIETGREGVWDTAVLNLGFRLPPDYDLQQLIAHAEAVRGQATLQFHAHEPAYQSGRDNPLYRAFSQAIRQAGGRPIPKLKTGTADMNVVAPIWQCPIVAYGPGDSQLDHTPHEHIELAEYARAIDILRVVIEKL
jgi:[amino group carrier protein]-lysine/ornithine hydrolase